VFALESTEWLNMRIKAVFLFLVFITLYGCTNSPISPPVFGSTISQPINSSNAIVLLNGTLIDGTGSKPLPNAALFLQNGRIAAVGQRNQVQIPEGAHIIDVKGATILPGFINAHVHDAYSADNLVSWAHAGVTTVRDEGILSRNTSLVELIDRRNREWIKPHFAKLVSTGWMISPPNGYGHLYISSPAEAHQKVNEELDLGADLIKLTMEDGYGSRSNLPLLSDEELKTIVAVAHKRSTRVSAHVTEAKFMQTVVNAGVDDVAHMAWDYVSEELMQEMIVKNIYVVSTLTVMEAFDVLSGSQTNVKRFVDLGGQLAMGNDYTDRPQNYFDHFELGMPMHELNRLAEAGLSPMEIIVASTKNAAHVCNLDEQLGTLEVGKIADVLVVDGDPTQDLNALLNVRLVIHHGSIIRNESQ